MKETRRRFRCLLLIAAAAALAPGPLGLTAQDGDGEGPAKKFHQAALIDFRGDIRPLTEHYLYRKLDKARAAGADLVIVQIDSPGGELEASLNLAERLRDVGWARTVSYVPREALSGAAIMSLGCDDIVMSQRAVLGDAGAIFLDDDFLFKHAPEKIRSHLAQKIRDLAEAKGRSPALAEAMIDYELVVYPMKNKKTAEITYMSDAEIASLEDIEQWEKLKPVFESRDKKFLEVNGRRAVELHLAKATVADFGELKELYGLDHEPLVFKYSGVDRTVHILNHGLVSTLLILIGLVALFIEFTSPGIGFGGLTAGLCFALFFWSRFLGGTAEWLEVLLFLAGVVFLLVELFVLPGFGVSGVAGALLIISSLVLASQSFVLPHSSRQATSLMYSLMVVVGAGSGAIVASLFVMSRMSELPILKRLSLPSPAEHAAAAATAAAHGRSAAATYQVGDAGVSLTALRPAGKCRFGDDYVDVVADGTFIAPNLPVEIVEFSGKRIIVRAVES